MAGARTAHGRGLPGKPAVKFWMSASHVLRRTGRSPFIRSVATLMGGNALAMVVPVLAAPVLGRLYQPADYGALAQYMAPAAVIGVVSTLQFQHVIIAERNDRTAGLAVWLSLGSSVAVALVTALAVAALWRGMLAGSAAGSWFALLPLTVAGAGVIATGRFLANRYRRYRWISLVQVSQILASVSVSIILGVLSWGANGLFVAYFVGQLIQVLIYLWIVLQFRNTFPPIVASRLGVVIRRHWKFPIFTLPSEFSSQATLQAPIFALSALGADASLGAFTRARQLISLPANVISQSVSQVFRRDAAEQLQKSGSCRKLMLRTALGLFLLGLGPTILVSALAPWMFSIYLGPAWVEAGHIARILAPMLLLQVVVAPISTVFFLVGRQGEDLAISVLTTIVVALCMLAASRITTNESGLVVAYSASLSLSFIVYFLRALQLSVTE